LLNSFDAKQVLIRQAEELFISEKALHRNRPEKANPLSIR
jgi:hypothetical protein